MQATILSEKVRFLSMPDVYGPGVRAVEARETSMSWVFLTPERVYKLKKPLKRPFLDFSTIARRRFYCREEFRLNRRLAADTYLGILPLRRDREGRYALGDQGTVVDWLVEMARLRDSDMLDHRIAAGDVAPREIEALADRLAEFYRSLPPSPASCERYLNRLSKERETNRSILLRPEFELGESTTDIIDAADRALARSVPEIAMRIASGWFLEGHGDLRPEHVWLGQPLQIIDCLEFSSAMRIVDPYDEVNYLGLECDVLGAGTLAGRLLDRLTFRLGHPPSGALLAAYGAYRALLRARLSISHLLDQPVRKPEKWRPLTLRYLEQARRELAGDHPL